jgi:hypothetical protein
MLLRPNCPYSTIGSSLVMYTIVSHKKGLYQIRNRLFFGLASSDIVLTTWMILGSIPLPAEGLGLMLGGKGNTRTCTAQGFFLQLAFAVPLYNAAIMVYYLLVIRYQIQDFRRIEPFLHGIAILLPLGLAIAGLFLKAFNPGPVGLCFAYPYPMGCDKRPNGVCQRGDNHKWVNLYFSIGILFGSLLVGYMCLALIYCTVHRRHATSTRSSQHRASSTGSSILAVSITSTATAKNLRQVAYNSLGYGAIFTITYLGPAILQAMILADKKPSFPLAVITSILLPSQGFLNGFFMFLRPLYLTVRKASRDKSWYWCLWYTLVQKTPRASWESSSNAEPRSTSFMRRLSAQGSSFFFSTRHEAAAEVEVDEEEEEAAFASESSDIESPVVRTASESSDTVREEMPTG